MTDVTIDASTIYEAGCTYVRTLQTSPPSLFPRSVFSSSGVRPFLWRFGPITLLVKRGKATGSLLLSPSSSSLLSRGIPASSYLQDSVRSCTRRTNHTTIEKCFEHNSSYWGGHLSERISLLFTYRLYIEPIKRIPPIASFLPSIFGAV